MKNLPGNLVQKGQVLLLVLLTMAVSLVVVLSITSRSITDVSFTGREEESQRAFSAAEAGVEKGLITGSGGTNISIGDATYSVTVSSLTSGQQAIHPNKIVSGESVIFWFVPQNLDGVLNCDANDCFEGNAFKLCWTSEGEIEPAIETSIFYDAVPGGNYAGVEVARVTADPIASTRTPANNFDSTDAGSCSMTVNGVTQVFEHQKTINLGSLGINSDVYGAQNGLQFVKVKMFYNTDPEQVGFVSTSSVCTTAGGDNCALPPQGREVVSTGVAGESTRKIEVVQNYNEPPWIFEGLFSETAITK